MRHFEPNDSAKMKARVAAAIENNPNIRPSELVRQTGLPIGLAIAALEKKAVA